MIALDESVFLFGDLEEAFAHESACYLDGYLGAALWLSPDGYPDEEATMRLFQRTVSEPIYAEAFAVFDQAGHAHPSEPHWYLPVMGIAPLFFGVQVALVSGTYESILYDTLLEETRGSGAFEKRLSQVKLLSSLPSSSVRSRAGS